MRIAFAQMDCKNNTAVFTDPPYRPYRGRNTDEEEILRDMELEYLLAIRDLQARLQEKYMPLLEDLVDMADDPESEIRLMRNEHFEVHREEWAKARRLYYT